MRSSVLDIQEAIVVAANTNLRQLINCYDGTHFAAGGTNGPYFDIETPIRNTAHWCIAYTVLSSQKPQNAYEQAAHELLGFLMKTSAYNKNGVYVHRQKHGKDWSNGVIGQAWVLEALAISGRILKRDDAVEFARKVSFAFGFDDKVKAWKATDPRNGTTAIDYTLNHQLWYAAALSELELSEHDRNIRSFLDSVRDGSMRVAKNGRIFHLLHKNSLKGLLFRMRYFVLRRRNNRIIETKEIGYHLYNLHPLARLKRRFPDHGVFSSEALKRAVSYVGTEAFALSLESNMYSYPYNAPGFEIPLICAAFDQEADETFLATQVNKTYCCQGGEGGFLIGCPDPLTLNARIYEYLLK